MTKSSSHENQTFLECLETNSNPSYPISSLVFSPNNSSFPSVLQAYIRNLRFNESTTRKSLFILTAQHESHIQASIIYAKSQGTCANEN
uniref:Carbohydrate oxidase n=1 Tax=Solanum tuberosum TaxID=4113 RepID=M1BWP9_SOLTU